MERVPRPINSAVLVFGAMTSGVALLLVYLLNLIGFSPMGFYIWFLVPLGALLVGLLAGCGYALGSYFTNVRVRRSMFLIIFAAGVVTFFLAHYITYQSALDQTSVGTEQATFVDYLQFICENTTYDIDIHDRDNAPWELGLFGYVFKALECAGFAFGGLFPLVILKDVPYCRACQFYRRKTASGVLNSEEKRDLLKKRKKKERIAIIEGVLTSIGQKATTLLESTREGPLARNLALVDGLEKEPDKQAIATAQFRLSKCPGCESHSVIATLRNVTVDGQSVATTLGRIDVEPARTGQTHEAA